MQNGLENACNREIKLLDIQPSQFYLSEEKISRIKEWFNPSDLSNFEPIPIKTLNGKIIFTDGHTRAWIAYEAGLTEVPYIWDEDDLDWDLYQQCVDACLEREVSTVADLAFRILSAQDYEKKWNGWCDKLQVENMNLFKSIKNYHPTNEQEEHDKEQMLAFIMNNDNYLNRENLVGHFTTSIWTINKEHTKTLMVYHNIYDSWSWIGGHADGDENLQEVALRELQEETGVKNARLLSSEIFSIETLTVDGHVKKGVYVPSHLHFNITYLAEADENEVVRVNEEENQAVKWFTFEKALEASTEPWMVEHVYKKLIEKSVEVF